MLTKSAQILTHASFMKDWMSFRSQLGNLEAVQKEILDRTITNHPYITSKKEFFDQPIRDYEMQTGMLKGVISPGTRLQPTSGTGDREKLIPYTRDFIRQLNLALNPWLFDIVNSHPGILSGKHYWSISWLPTHWRKNGWMLDDFDLFPAWKKNVIRLLLAVPNEVSKAPTLASTQFSTLAWLVASEDLTFLSVWSPTFLLQLLELMEEWRGPLVETLQTGKWCAFQEELKYLPAPKNSSQAKRLHSNSYVELWPKLQLISSWDSSSSSVWAKKLQSQFPGTAFQGKGLWSTEGVVSIPFEGQFVMSYLSHYYEFIDLSNGNLIPSFHLKEGMEVHPVLTCANGYTRYRLQDRLVVTGFKNKVPTLEFQERDETFDMVGEKITTETFKELHDLLKESHPSLAWVSVFVVNEKSQKPYYAFIFEGEGNVEEVGRLIDKFLHEHFHYHLAREIGQLGGQKIVISHDAFARYERFQLERGMVQGNIKVELATKITSERDLAIFLSTFVSSCHTIYP